MKIEKRGGYVALVLDKPTTTDCDSYELRLFPSDVDEIASAFGWRDLEAAARGALARFSDIDDVECVRELGDDEIRPLHEALLRLSK